MKLNFKKLAMLGFAVSLASGAIMPKQADAYILVGGRIIDRNPIVTTLGIVLCLSFLPVCLIDEDGKDSSISKANLLEQGFSEGEIAKIMQDQEAMMIALDGQNAVLTVESFDTKETIRQDILSLVPNASVEYVNFVTEMKGL